MIIFAIDDEAPMLAELQDAIAEAKPDAEIRGFRNAQEPLRIISEDRVFPDVVFSDIEMPGMDGLKLAARIRQIAPQAKIIFVTGYSQYAVEAYRHRINGYMLKPVDAAQVREELAYIQEAYREEPDKLQVRCFGSFEVYWQGKAVVFSRKQTKEFFAYLIDRNSVCSSEEIAATLWEEETDLRACKTRIRSLVHDLKNTFRQLGLEDILIRTKDRIGLHTEKIDCDYYRFLKGDIQAVNAFRGVYMSEYSWAEDTLGELLFARHGR